jgi:hypothetical protein
MSGRHYNHYYCKRFLTISCYHLPKYLLMKINPILFLLLAMLASCDLKNNNPDACGCSGTRACTDVFVGVTVKLQNRQGQPYLLDTFSIKRMSNGEDVTNFGSYGPEPGTNGNYTLATDLNLKQIEKCGEDFVLTGMKDGKKVLEHRYTLAHDCCHVRILKGQTEVVIE